MEFEESCCYYVYARTAYIYTCHTFIHTRTSLDRLGPAVFMARKLKRLGIPFCVYFFGLSPLLYFMIFGWPNGFVKPADLPAGIIDNSTAANFSRDLKGSAEYVRQYR